MPEFVDQEFVPKVREYPKGPRGPRARSDEQKRWDAAFETAMNGKGYFAVQIAPADAEDAQKRVMACARFFDKAVTEGEPQPGREKGTVVLAWMIRNPKKRGPRKQKDAETPA